MSIVYFIFFYVHCTLLFGCSIKIIRSDSVMLSVYIMYLVRAPLQVCLAVTDTPRYRGMVIRSYRVMLSVYTWACMLCT